MGLFFLSENVFVTT